MFYLKNPGGRIVYFDTEQEFETFRVKSGYREPSKQELDEYLAERKKIIDQVLNPPKTQEQINQEIKDQLFLATVSPGGTDGYSIEAKLMVRELEKLGMKVVRNYAGQNVGLLFHNPYSLQSMRSKYKIIYTMFESTRIPDDWREYLEVADQVIVPSHWCQAVFKKAGIEALVVPLGYDEEVFKPTERENKLESRKDFVFLHYNAFNIRKGFLEVYKAFNKAFRKDEPVKLIFKTVLTDAQQRFPINPKLYPRIEIIEGKTSEQELLKIIGRSDCFVFPSRGEGFGLTPLECMATGIPAIVPNAHGISEYFDPKFMYEVKVKEECPALYSRYKGIDVGKMVVCDVDDLAKQMRYVYEHQDEAAEKGKKAAEYAKKYTSAIMAKNLESIIKDVITRPARNSEIINDLPLRLI